MAEGTNPSAQALRREQVRLIQGSHEALPAPWRGQHFILRATASKALEFGAGELHNQFTFLKAHAGCPAESRPDGAWEESRSLLRRPPHDPRYKTPRAWVRVRTAGAQGKGQTRGSPEDGSGRVCSRVRLGCGESRLTAYSASEVLEGSAVD